MNFKTMLCFSGRATRADYWLSYLIILCGLLGALLLGQGANLFPGIGDVVLVAYIVAWLAFSFWVSVAVTVCRLHDRNKSGWWLLAYWFGPGAINVVAALVGSIGGHLQVVGGLLVFVSLMITIATFIELGFFRGTVGANAWGADPIDVPPALPVAA